jgi:hypothetical protein
MTHLLMNDWQLTAIHCLIQGGPGKFKINTKNAGDGYLHVSVVGPSKVFITCLEEKDSKVYNVSVSV